MLVEETDVLQFVHRRHEPSTTLISDSPVSSIDGWRQHGNLFRSKLPGLAV